MNFRRILVRGGLSAYTAIILSTAAVLVVARAVGAGDPLPGPRADAPLVQVGPELRQPVLALPAGVQADLRARRWAPAADALLALGADAFPEPDRDAWAFVTAWALVRDDRPADAVPLLPLLADSDDVPAPHLHTVRGEVLWAAGEPVQALEVLQQVPDDASIWGRAAVLQGEVLRELGRTKEAFALYERLAGRPDPALGNPEALLALGFHHGAGSAEGYPHLRRLWTEYPLSEPAEEGRELLKGYSKAEHRPTWQEVGRRAEHLMAAGLYRQVLAETEGPAASVEGGGVDACRFAYARGRSFYRTNQLTNAIGAFGAQGRSCEGDDASEYGAKILYLEGMAWFRKGKHAEAAEPFEAIADLYPHTTLADDGLLHAGIALQEAGDLEGAQVRWRRALDAFSDGDMVPEATWRLALSLYLSGDTDGAREIAVALGGLPLSGDPVHVAAGRYWSARWLLYPDVEAPNAAVDDPELKRAAVEGWRDLCRDLPHSFYAILAYSRLVEVAPDVATALAQRSPDHDAGALDQPWLVRREFLDHAGIRTGADLVRLGLVAEGLAEWHDVGTDDVTGDEMAWMTELRIRSGDWLYAHDAMRGWMRTHPPSTLGPREPQVLRVAYPDRYWAEVRAASAGDRYDSRLLHALVREESNFNTHIRSHAGARGLSQLMPGTAREVAGWLGKSVTTTDLEDPATNLELGARYFDTLHKQLDGSPYLSLAGYNAGAGRVGQWKDRWGNVPTDEYVERIPFKETREYVKRVMGTWQTMRWQFDEDAAAFPDLSAYNHQALPG